MSFGIGMGVFSAINLTVLSILWTVQEWEVELYVLHHGDLGFEFISCPECQGRSKRQADNPLLAIVEAHEKTNVVGTPDERLEEGAWTVGAIP